MRILQTEINRQSSSYLSLIERDDAFSNAHLHCHPEMELVYIVESYGKTIAEGDISPKEDQPRKKENQPG